jgi:opacity protein-like surface antigen
MIRKTATVAFVLIVLVGFVLTSVAPTALAEDSVGGQFYVEIRGGMAAPQTIDLNDIDVGSQLASEVYGLGKLHYKVGGAGGLAGGYQISNHFRTELEVSFRTAKYDKIDFRDIANTPVSGKASSLTSMVNAYYDVRMSADQPIVPYVGGGLGVGWVKYDPSLPGAPGLDEDQVSLAWNAGFGIYWRIVEGIGITGGYRYVGSTKLEFKLDNGDDVEMPFGMHETTVGVRFTF